MHLTHLDIDCQDAIPVIVANLVNRAKNKCCGVGDHDIDPSLLFSHIVDPGLERCRIRHINTGVKGSLHAHAVVDGFGDRLALLRPAAAEVHRGTFQTQQLHHRLANRL